MTEVYNERIDKIFSALGLMSRKDCAKTAKCGRITVNEKIEKNSARKVTEKDILCLDGEKIIYSEYMYILLNKPRGYVCAAEDGKYPTVFELLPKNYSNLGLFTVGRLDMNTTGVLIVTNDGKLSHALLSPKNNIHKIYRAETKFPVSDEDITKAAEGIMLDGNEKALPAYISKKEDLVYDIRVCEGKFHLIKRIFLALHNQVRSLKRIEFAGITIDNLKESDWRFLEIEEILSLKSLIEV